LSVGVSAALSAMTNKVALSGLSVLIPDGEHDVAFKIITSLAQIPKIRIHVISSRQHPRARYSRFCSSFALRREGSEQKWFNQIREIVEQKQVQVILPAHAEAVRFASKWRKQLSEFAALPFLPETHAFDVAVEKGSLARFLYEHDLPTPRTVPAARALENPEIAFPLLIKPRYLCAGVGIQNCPDRRTLEEFISAHQHSLENYIVQEFVDGRDLGATMFCKDGEILAHTQRQWTRPGPRPFAPSLSVRLIHSAQLLEIVTRLMAALNWSGIANVGTRYNERTQRPEILDFNPRFGGNLMCSTAAGINFPYLSCLTALKLPLPESRYRLQEYMEIEDAANRIVRKLRGHSEVIPNLMRETNLQYILRDPVPYLNRKCERWSGVENGLT
jgi:D-aspartate ligase